MEKSIFDERIGAIKKGLEIGLGTSNKYMYTQCSVCGKRRWVLFRFNTGRPVSDRCHTCALKSLRGRRSISWKGGKPKTGDGYIMVAIDEADFFYPMARGQHRLVLEHRLIMARYLNRCLNRRELIHHKNGIKTDNRIENLEIVSRRQHTKDHVSGYKLGYQHACKDIEELRARVTLLDTEITLLRGQLEAQGRYGYVR